MLLTKKITSITISTPTIPALWRAFAMKMRVGSASKTTKDSAGRRLGLKKSGGEAVRRNVILARQRGFKFRPGENVIYGKDHTLHSAKEGIVMFTEEPVITHKKRKVLHIVPQEIPNRYAFPPFPFMYHPELYPQLAQNNQPVDPLLIPDHSKFKPHTKNKNPKYIGNKVDSHQPQFQYSQIRVNISPQQFKHHCQHAYKVAGQEQLEHLGENVKIISNKYKEKDNDAELLASLADENKVI